MAQWNNVPSIEKKNFRPDMCTSRPRFTSPHFADETFKLTVSHKNYCILIQIPSKSVSLTQLTIIYNIGLDNDLVLSRQPAIIWTNNSLDYRRI